MKKPLPADVCIIGGAGHVGLPLGVTIALSGLRVTLVDVNKKALSLIAKGRFPFKEEGGEAALRKVLRKKLLSVDTKPSAISKARIVILVVGTPVDKYLNPQFADLDRTIAQYFKHFRDGQVLMLRSTIFPGTTERLQRHFDKKKLKVSVAFCPERVVEGKAIHEIQTMPQIVSGFNQETIDIVSTLFNTVSRGGVVEAKPVEAELAKLYSNAWRYITFAVANQFYMMATDRGADYARVHQVMTDKYDRMKGLPRAGFAAGPCLFKDTMQLAAFNQNRFFLGHSAMLVNEGLPRFVIEHIKHRLCNNDLHEKTIGVLGMTFKAESDDVRDSLSFKIRKLAEVEAKEVYAHDYYVKDDSFTKLDALLRKSDIIIVATPHKRYAQIPKAKFKNKIIVDIWNHLPHTKDAFEI